VQLFIPRPDPDGASSLIRDLTGERNRTSKGLRVHVHAAHHIPMPDKGTLGVATPPHPSAYFVFPAAYWTLAARSPLRTSEALDAGCLGFIGQIGDILTVLPPGEALIVMPSAVALAHTVWIANE
jgi:hypothetical protein